MDRDAADRLITAYLPKLYGFAMNRAFSYSEAEEICAAVVEEVYASLLRAETVIHPDRYIRRISEHVFARYVREVKRQEGISIDGLELQTEDEYPLEASEEAARLRREIAFLTKTRREIVYLFYFKAVGIYAIARRLGIPEGTVKWHLNRARNELKEAFSMERSIGRLGLHPVEAEDIWHSGFTHNSGPEKWLGDSLSLNAVYSVYWEPKTTKEIAEELGVTPVFLEPLVEKLEGGGFLEPVSHGRYTTHVWFSPETYSLEERDRLLERQQEAARMLVRDYVPLVRDFAAGLRDVYIPGGNRELLESTLVFCGIENKCAFPLKGNLGCYRIKPPDGGEYIARPELKKTCADPDYVPSKIWPSYAIEGSMWRESKKYPVRSWCTDSRLSDRPGGWGNNENRDYEYLYEAYTGRIRDDIVSAEKYRRLRERGFLTPEGKVGIMVVQGDMDGFMKSLPAMDGDKMKPYADFALETAMVDAKKYPPQMRDLVVAWDVAQFIGSTVAIMTLDMLYADGTFRALTKEEKVAANLLMFADQIPAEA